MAGDDLERTTVTTKQLRSSHLGALMVMNKGVTRMYDRISAQGYGHRAHCNVRPGSRKFSYSHEVS